MSWAGANLNTGVRFLLHAYICDRSSVMRVHDLGTRTLNQIFFQRPLFCRHAVVTDDHGQVWSIDLLMLTATHDDAGLISGLNPPNNRTAYPDPETAITATVMLYGEPYV